MKGGSAMSTLEGKGSVLILICSRARTWKGLKQCCMHACFPASCCHLMISFFMEKKCMIWISIRKWCSNCIIRKIKRSINLLRVINWHFNKEIETMPHNPSRVWLVSPNEQLKVKDPTKSREAFPIPPVEGKSISDHCDMDCCPWFWVHLTAILLDQWSTVQWDWYVYVYVYVYLLTKPVCQLITPWFFNTRCIWRSLTGAVNSNTSTVALNSLNDTLVE